MATAPGPQPARPAGAVVAFQRLADRLSLAAAYAAAGCLLAMVLLVLAEISVGLLSRVFPAVPSGIRFAWEYSAYLMGAAFMLGGALTLRAGMQIRVELLLHMQQGRFRRPLEMFSSLVGALFLGMLTWSLTTFTWQSWSSSQVSADTLTPLWIPQGVLALATAIFAVQAFARLLTCIAGNPLDNDDFKVASASE